MRIGFVEYINTLPFSLPFRLGIIETNFEFVYEIPSELNRLLRHDDLDIALVSSVEYLQGNYSLAPGFGIACADQIMSVNLYTQLPISDLTGKRVGLTHHSATSVELLKVLCYHLWKIEPKFELLDRKEPLSKYAAFLLIGDEALANVSVSSFETIDLGLAWHTLTGLPFVFALFAAKKQTSAENIAFFQTKLEAALDWSCCNKTLVEEEGLKQCRVDAALLSRYFSILQYRMEKKEMEGLNRFNELRQHVPAKLS